MNDFTRNVIVAGLGSMVYYIFSQSAHRSTSSIEMEILFKTFCFGSLAGLILSVLSQLGGKKTPLVSSWPALAICIFMIEPLMITRDIFWNAFLQGCIAYLLWQGYRGRLRKM